MNPHPMQIAFLGDLTADIYVRQKLTKLGGAALNSAIWASRKGAKTSILSAIGSDQIGKKFDQKIKTEGIDGTFVQHFEGVTSSIDIFVDNAGERQYGTWRPGVLKDFHILKSQFRAIGHFDALCVTVYPTYFHVINEIRHVKGSMRGKPFVAVNFGDMREFQRDLVFVSQTIGWANMLVFGLDKDIDEQMINELITMVPANTFLLVTLGSYGSLVRYAGHTHIEASRAVRMKDATGSGDAFIAAYLTTFLRTHDIQAALRMGSDFAAKAIQKVGAY